MGNKISLCDGNATCQDKCNDICDYDEEEEKLETRNSNIRRSRNVFPDAPELGSRGHVSYDLSTKKNEDSMYDGDSMTPSVIDAAQAELTEEEKRQYRVSNFLVEGKRGKRVTLFINGQRYHCAYKISADHLFITFAFSRKNCPEMMDIIISLRTLHSMIKPHERPDLFGRIPMQVRLSLVLMLIDKDQQFFIKFESEDQRDLFNEAILLLQSHIKLK